MLTPNHIKKSKEFAIKKKNSLRFKNGKLKTHLK